MSIPMEGMDEGKAESHLTSAAAFVEGGVQEACEDSCSICLEAFCDSDPCTVTSCKHEFHLQCILEWCQRSSNCPMCWQAISLKDPTSQELLEAVEEERNFRFNAARNSTIFHHPSLGDFELQHLPVGVNDAELEERIIQHLAAAAAMGRAHHVGRREGSRTRPSAHSRPQFLVFSAHHNAPPAGTISPSPAPVGEEPEPAAIIVDIPSVPLTSGEVEVAQHMPTSGSAVQIIREGPIHHRSSSSQSSQPDQDRAGPSDFQSVSDSWRSRLNSISLRYKESISKSMRGWKEKLFSRSTSMSTIGSEVRREMNAGIANVSRIIEQLEIRDSNRNAGVSASSNLANSADARHEITPSDNNIAAPAASAVSH